MTVPSGPGRFQLHLAFLVELSRPMLVRSTARHALLSPLRLAALGIMLGFRSHLVN